MWGWPLSPVKKKINFILKIIREFYFYNRHFARVSKVTNNILIYSNISYRSVSSLMSKISNMYSMG